MLFTRSPTVLISVLIANGLAYSFFVITLPVIGRQLSFSDVNTSLILGISALIITLVSPLWGSICELWGRRRVILYGILATTIFNIFSALVIKLRLDLALSIHIAFILLLSVRVFNSLFTGGLKPAGQAYIADITSPENRAKGMGLMGAAFGVGAIMGGIASMISGSKHLLEAYLIITVLLTGTCLLAAFKLQESQYKKQSNKLSVSLAMLTKLPYSRVWLFLLITFIGLTIFSLLQHVVPLTLQDRFQLSADMAIRKSGMTMMLTMLIMIITQALIVRKLSLAPRYLLLFGCLLALISMILAAVAFTVPMLMLSVGLFGFGLGLLLPGNLASLSLQVNENSQAAAAGVNGIGQGFGLAAGPVLGVTLHKFTLFTPYLGCTILLGIVFLLLTLYYRQGKAALN